ncbi:PepSY-associated TM helix domain-containing protein [Paraherbaspirillum soli]|uniref:PepSY-associated TM helix domain-containing protein n=1 Tax=Paraherbaspirillum soli TaxID=631222 RepID=A0ABW0M939_9BURK
MNQSHHDAAAAKQALLARRKSLFWRIHFWAALIASPFTLAAALTGILYIFTPQIEAQLYGALEHVAPSGVMRPLDDSVAAARAAAPAGWALHSVVPAYAAGDTVKATFSPPAKAAEPAAEHAGHNHGMAAPVPAPKRAFGAPSQAITVYVNPYTAEAVGSLVNQERFGSWAKKLHSSLLQGDGWRWMIELAASWLMVMLITGIALWWPRGTQKALPQAGAKGRIAWKQWHAFIGVVLSVMSAIILSTGLTWSKYAGGQIRMATDSLGQAAPKVPRDVQSIAADGAAPLSWQAVWDATRRQAPDGKLQLVAPGGPQGVWSASSADRSQPEKRFDLLLDAYSGQALYYSGWDKQTAFGKATAIGIPFHRGEFGWWNQALLLVFGVGVLFSLVSGWVMFFKRRQPGSLGLPRLLPGAWKSGSLTAWATAAVLLGAMPLLALSALAVVAVEIVLHRRSMAVGSQ